MVAGIKGLAFLDDDEMVTSSSTKNEVYVISRGTRKIVRKASMGDHLRIESICVVPGTKRVLVAEGDGTVCDVDFAQDPPVVSCVATSEHFEGPPPRLTSVAAWDEHSCFVAGAIKDQKDKCSVRHVDLKTSHISETTLLDAKMIRALIAEKDKGRLLVGVVENFEGKGDAAEVADSEEKELDGKKTNLVALYPESDAPSKTLATVDFFVHVISKHPKEDDTYVLLRRHSASASTPVCVVIRLHDKSGGKADSATKHISTIKITLASAVALNSYESWMAYVFGYRAGREHALAVAPCGTAVVTGCVHKSSKGILQVWGLTIAPEGEDLPPSGCLP